MDILVSGKDSTKIRDQVMAVLTNFNTKDLNLESLIVQPGYTRTLRQLLYTDKTGKMQEMQVVRRFYEPIYRRWLGIKDTGWIGPIFFD